LNSGVNERLGRDVIIDILHGLSPTHPECPPNWVRPTCSAASLGCVGLIRCDVLSTQQHNPYTEKGPG
jgi:hypothetical protein